METMADDSLIDQSVVLIKRPSGITGIIRTGKEIYSIRPLKNGSHRIIKIDESRLPQDHSPNFTLTEAQGGVAIDEREFIRDPRVSFEREFRKDRLQIGLMAKSIQQQTAKMVADSEDIPEIKILVAYTEAVDELVDDIEGMIELAIAETNLGYENSDVKAKISLAHSYKVEGYKTLDITDALDAFEATDDGIMDEVHELRNEHGADVAVLVMEEGTYCGEAAEIGAKSSTAFVALYYECLTSGYTLGHEIGHLQGARHNPEQDPDIHPYYYGHGYQHPFGYWRTIMAYNCPGWCGRINYWSNPDKKCGRSVLGTHSKHNNARVLNLTAPFLAKFKSDNSENNVNQLSETGLKGYKFSFKHYEIELPAGVGELKASTSGGTGNVAIMIREGKKPTRWSQDCRSRKRGNNDTCAIKTPEPGVWYVSLYGDTNYKEVDLNITWE